MAVPEAPNKFFFLFALVLFIRLVSEATRLRVKGREFTVTQLLRNAYKAKAEKCAGGALAIFRLAPQGYYHFYSPVGYLRSIIS
jgi:phosphatidylserine decarboxylase